MNFTQRKQELKLARRIRNLAIIVIVGGIVAAGEYMPVMHRAQATAPTHEKAVATPTDYFPAQFPAVKGEPETHVEAF
ncbi:MAG: hypothetical protein ACJ8DM_18460 [Microvirga sp.]